jgi:Domain of unknown function (DUF1707)
VPGLLVSDREREYTIGLLHEHLLSGRLTAEEFEERVDEACRARLAEDLWRALRQLPVEPPPVSPPPPRSRGGSASASLVLGIMGLGVLCVSLGMLFVFALPISVTAWALGRETRLAGESGVARTGEVLGIVGTVLSLVFFAGCASVFVL